MATRFHAAMPLLVLSCLGSAAAATTLPAALVTSDLSDGATKIVGKISKADPGNSVAIHYFVDDHEDVYAAIFINAATGDFTIEPSQPVKGGTTVKITYTIGTAEASAFTKPIEKPETPKPVNPTVFFVEATAGLDTVKVYFAPDKTSKSGTITIQQGAVTIASHDLTADELAAGLAPVKLPHPAVPTTVPGSDYAALVSIDGSAEAAATVHHSRNGRITVQFKAGKVSKNGTISVKQNQQPIASRDLTKQELIAGSAEVALPAVPASAANTTGSQPKGFEAIVKIGGTTTTSFDVISGRMGLERPIQEGDTDIRGTAGPGVTKVRVVVFNAELITNSETRGAFDSFKDYATKVKASQVLYRQSVAARDPQITAMQADLMSAQRSTALNLSDILDSANTNILYDTVTAVTDGSFKVTSSTPLDPAFHIVAFQVIDGQPSGSIENLASAVVYPVNPVSISIGRFHGSFLTGGAVGPSAGKFATGVYLGFVGDMQILTNVVNKDFKTGAGGTFLRNFRQELRAFGEVRLTQTGTADSSAAGSGAAATSLLPISSTFTSVQSGFAQFGIYAPFSFKGLDWDWRGVPYSFFVAPLIKAGVAVPDGGVLISRTTSVSLKSDGTISDPTVSEVRRNGGMPFASGGFRFGITNYALIASQVSQNTNSQVSPELVMYFDMTYGPYSQYRTYSPDYSDTKTPADTPTPGYPVVINSTRKNRVQLETRLKIPFAPVQVGFDWNGSTRLTSVEPNDWRVIVAYRIDTNKLLGKIFKAGN